MAFRSDDELVKRSREGEQRAFSELHAKYSRRIRAYCRQLIGNDATAADLVQTTFTKAFTSLAALDHPALFSHWLFTIARNEVYLHVRKARRNGTVALTDDEVWDENSPHDELVTKETQELIEQGLNQLKVEYREVLVLRQFERLTYAEIAALTGDSLSAVESRLFKARKALATKLDQVFERRKPR